MLGVAGWRGYDYWQTKKAGEAGTAFEVAADLAQQGKHSEAEAAFDKLAANATGAYRSLALLRGAAEAAQTDPKAAVAAYDKIAADTSVASTMRDLALLRAGALLVDAGSYEDARARLEPLTGEGDAACSKGSSMNAVTRWITRWTGGTVPMCTFRHTARELLAIAAWHAGNSTAAKRWIDIISTDPETLPDERSRMEMLGALMGSGGKT